MQCAECGCRQILRRVVEGYLVDECQICGHVEGDADSVEEVHSIREARDRGIDPEIYPLVRAMDRIPGLKVVASSAGGAESGMAPFVQFQFAGKEGLRQLERLTAAVSLFNRGSSKAFWVLELAYTRQLVVYLKPSFHHGPRVPETEDLARSREDLRELSRRFEAQRVEAR